jgi:hypothetical protein
MEQTLRHCREVFTEYWLHHLDKDPPDFEKAQRNKTMADLCDRAIGFKRPALRATVPPWYKRWRL